MQDHITAVKGLGMASRPCYAGKYNQLLCGICNQLTMELAYNKLCLALQSSSSSLIYAGMPEQ